MNTGNRELFVRGFLKRAAACGYGESPELQKQALRSYENWTKEAAIGLGLDAAMLGVPSMAGAMIGGNYSPISTQELKDELTYHEDPSISKALKYLLVPGYTGYRAAKTNRLDRAYQKYRDEQPKQ
jgi:hypothetical protein